jgi:hypothetical protein
MKQDKALQNASVFQAISLSVLQPGALEFALRETTRKSTGMRREQMNTFAAGAIGDGFMQLSAKSTDPNG